MGSMHAGGAGCASSVQIVRMRTRWRRVEPGSRAKASWRLGDSWRRACGFKSDVISQWSAASLTPSMHDRRYVRMRSRQKVVERSLLVVTTRNIKKIALVLARLCRMLPISPTAD